MPRIRSIKPEFFRSRVLSECSVRARLTFIGLWTVCDDEGRYRYEPELLRADLWPFEEHITVKDVAADVLELARRLVVCVYEVAGRCHLHVVNWHEHQKINRPSASRLPECSRSPHGGFPDDSPSPHALDLGSRILDLGSGSTTIVEQAQPIDDVVAVFQTWVATLGDNRGRLRLTPKRRTVIKARLADYPAADVIDAARGWVNDPWPERPHHNDLTVLLRNGEQLEKFRDLWRHGPPATMGKHTAQMANIARQMAAMAPPKEVTAGDLGGMERDRALAQRQLPGPEA